MQVRLSANVVPERPRRPRRSPLPVMAVVALALVTGLLLVLAGRSSDASRPGPAGAAAGGRSSSPQPTQRTVTVPPGPGSMMPAVPAVPSSSSPTAGPSVVGGSAELRAQPSSGANGAVVTVTGSGWQPGAVVRLQYREPAGTPTGAAATATPDAAGRFSAQIVALDPTNTPGPHRITAGNGRQTSATLYLATS